MPKNIHPHRLFTVIFIFIRVIIIGPCHTSKREFFWEMFNNLKLLFPEIALS